MFKTPELRAKLDEIKNWEPKHIISIFKDDSTLATELAKKVEKWEVADIVELYKIGAHELATQYASRIEKWSGVDIVKLCTAKAYDLAKQYAPQVVTWDAGIFLVLKTQHTKEADEIITNYIENAVNWKTSLIINFCLIREYEIAKKYALSAQDWNENSLAKLKKLNTKEALEIAEAIVLPGKFVQELMKARETSQLAL